MKLERCIRAGQVAVLRAMLETLVEHREAVWLATPEEPLTIICAADLPLLPSWRSRMQRAAEDGVKESLHASIREEGWRAYAEGGLAAMHALFDAATGDNDYLAGILDHRWDGIGNKRGGIWVV